VRCHVLKKGKSCLLFVSKLKYCFVCRLELVLAFIGLLLFVTPTYSNEMTNHGFTSRSISLGGAVTADVNDVSALYYNPAGIAAADTKATVNFLLSLNALKIDLYKKEDAHNLPTDAYNTTPVSSVGTSRSLPIATGANANDRSSTENKNKSMSLVLGLTLDLGVDWIKVAIATFLPLQETSTSTYFPDGREQHFSNKLRFSTLGQQATGPVFMFGTGLTPVKWLRFGATVIMFRKDTETFNALLSNPSKKSFADDTQEKSTFAFTQIDKQRELAASFNLGLQIDVHDQFAIGLSYRHRMSSIETLVSKIEVYDYSRENTPPPKPRFSENVRFSHDYNPSDLTLGFRIGMHCPWALYIDATWRMWKKYDALGDGTSKKEFHDVVIPRLGFEYEINGRIDLRLGMAYIVNPVYDQDGETNFVDNDQLDFAVGLRLDLPWPENASLDIHAKFLFLIPRTFEKDERKMQDGFPESVNLETGELYGDTNLQTNNPGFPGYESRGVVASFGTAINVPF